MSKNQARKSVMFLPSPVSKTSGIYSIHAAARLGSLTKVSEFLKSGVDVNARDDMGDAPIHYACASMFKSQCKIVKMLLEHGADPFTLSLTGQTVLHLAAFSRSPNARQTIEYLMCFGVPIDLSDELGRTTLHCLARTPKFRAKVFINFFIVNGADVSRCMQNIESISDENIFPLIRSLAFTNYTFSDVKELFKGLPNEFAIQNIKPIFERCNQALDKLKRSHLSQNLSYYEFLIAKKESTAKLAENQPQLLFILRKTMYQFKEYFLELEDKYKLFCEFFVRCYLPETISSYNNVKLNFDCIELIANYLELNDLVNLCIAFNIKGLGKVG